MGGLGATRRLANARLWVEGEAHLRWRAVDGVESELERHDARRLDVAPQPHPRVQCVRLPLAAHTLLSARHPHAPPPPPERGTPSWPCLPSLQSDVSKAASPKRLTRASRLAPLVPRPSSLLADCDIGMGCSLGGSGFRAAYSDSAEPISSDVCPTGTMFPAPFKDGAGGVGYLTQRSLHYSIVDKVRVPQEEGEYVLSWRWDCEESDQVWMSCADVEIAAMRRSTFRIHDTLITCGLKPPDASRQNMSCVFL
mgnify:CR=1 FL=1